MHQQRMKDATYELDERIVRALERAPDVTVPAEFAARVAGRLPERRAFAVRPARYGLMAMRISMAALVIALLLVAMYAGQRGNVVARSMEWLLCIELVGLAVWQGRVYKLFEPEM